MPSIEKFQFMDKKSISLLVNELINKSNIRLNERIVKELNANSSNKQALSAKALYKLLSGLNEVDGDITSRLDDILATLEDNAESIRTINEEQVVQDGKLADIETNMQNAENLIGTFKHLTIETVTGSLDSITEPNNTVLYFQRDNEDDTTWMLYIHNDELGWINIGDTELDLSHIWSKDDIEEMKEALNLHDVEPISDVDINDIIETVFEENKFDPRMEPVGVPEVTESVVYGSSLDDVEIKGTMMYEGVEVPGTFVFVTTKEEFNSMMKEEV